MLSNLRKGSIFRFALICELPGEAWGDGIGILSVEHPLIHFCFSVTSIFTHSGDWKHQKPKTMRTLR
jgi:hypothetical protein